MPLFTETPVVPPAMPVTTLKSHPQVIAYSETADAVLAYSDGTAATTAAVLGVGIKGAAGVLGFGHLNDGVRGQSQGDGMSGVAGIHGGNGHGVYGRSALGDAGYFQGNLTVTGTATVNGDILLTGADCAEQFPVAADLQIEPGTVVVISPDGGLQPSTSAYDRKVAGVVAGAGSYRPGIVLDSECAANCVKVAMLGKVFCQVDADFGSIEIGDLLTSSMTHGHAMVVTDRNKAFGSVIGKAMAALKRGRGLIPILVALQ
jgi:hypothetical protein